MQEKLFVYVLRSDVDTARHYVGLTANVTDRLAAHNAGQSVHTARSRPWSLAIAGDIEPHLAEVGLGLHASPPACRHTRMEA